MKTVLVAIGGTSSDEAVLEAAYTLAQSLKAHLDFIHIPLSSIDAPDPNPDIKLMYGEGLDVAPKDPPPSSVDATSKARGYVANFCAERNILEASSPGHFDRVTASWIEIPMAPGIDSFMRAARTHDLTVMGRSFGQRRWSRSVLEAIVTTSGRPVLIVPHDDRLRLDRIAVWWKDDSAAARALTAALPILRTSNKVTIISVIETDNGSGDTATDLAIQLGWHGVDAAVEVLGRDYRPTIGMLWTASLAKKTHLVVMGAFSRSRVREMIFGGCTQSVLEDSARPIFLLH